MKYAFILAIIGILLHSGYSWGFKFFQDQDKLTVAAQNAREKCAQYPPVSQQIIQMIVNKTEVDKNSPFIKRIYCVGTELGYKNPDGSLNGPMTKEVFGTILGNSRFDDVIENCMQQQGAHPSSDPLEVTSNQFQCAQKRLDPATLYKVYGYLNQLPSP